MPHRDIAIFSILLRTGLRVTELCRLDYKHIRRDKKTGGIVFKEVRCKGNRYFDIFLDSRGAEDLDNYLKQERGKEAGPLFYSYEKKAKHVGVFYKGSQGRESKEKKRITRYTIWRITKRLARIAKVAVNGVADIEVSPHRLRHERAYNLLEAGLSESEVAEELRHSDGSRYVGLYIKRTDRKRYDRLNNIE